jgi:hypothetical protein
MRPPSLVQSPPGDGQTNEADRHLRSALDLYRRCHAIH